MEVKMSPEGGLHVPGLTSNEVHTVDDVNRVTTLTSYLGGVMRKVS